MWSVPDFFTNAIFTATIDSVPRNMSNIKYKDKVKIAQQDIEDWIVYDRDSLIFGNFISNSLQE